MHTIKQIIENQKRFKKPILKWLNKDLKESKKKLAEIDSKNEYIQEHVNKLKDKFKKTLHKKEVDKLFFMHPKRNENFYVWWDDKEQEVVILSYGKK